MRIAFLTSSDPRDRRSWSGIHYYMMRALQKHCGEVIPLGPAHAKRLKPLRLLSGLLRRLTGKRYDYGHSPWLSREFGRIFTEKLRAGNYDMIYASSASTELAYVETALPIAYLADATFANMIDYYQACANLLPLSKRHSHFVERKALTKSSLLLYPSEWAARSAINDYGASSAKTFVVPLGANLEEPPSAQEVLSKRKTDTCRLLFLGVEWKRKGGDVAFETLLELKKCGVKARLTICGCTPPDGISDPDLVVTGFLNKNIPEQRKQFERLLLDSDFLLLPTRAECYGIVFCEASAYGLPSIVRDTGGVGGAVREGVNGRLLPASTGAEEYSRVIREIFSDEAAYLALVRNSRMEYENRLNWDCWGKTIAGLFDRYLFPYETRQDE